RLRPAAVAQPQAGLSVRVFFLKAATAFTVMLSVLFCGGVVYSMSLMRAPMAGPPPTRTDHPVATENAKRGNADWGLRGSPDAVRGFVSPISVLHGRSLALYASTKAPAFRIDVYRMGWYGGAGARLGRSTTD